MGAAETGTGCVPACSGFLVSLVKLAASASMLVLALVAAADPHPVCAGWLLSTPFHASRP